MQDASPMPVPPGPDDQRAESSARVPSGEVASLLFAALVENSDDAIISKSLGGRITGWNAAAERIFGYTATEAIGQPITILVPPERRQEQEHILARLQNGERIDHLETVRLHRNGAPVAVSLTISPLKDGSGKVVGAADIARDITRRQETEQHLREREEQLRLLLEAQTRQAQLLDQAYEGILVRDAQDAIVYWNRGAERVYGWTAAEAQGRVSHDLLQTIFPAPLETIRAALAVNGHWEGELTHITRDGQTVTVLSHWVRESGREPAQVLETNFDLTEQKRLIARQEQSQAEADAERRFRERLETAAEELRAANEELQQQNHEIQQANRYKSEFLASMSHELRTPLHTVLGFVQLLAEELDGPLNPKQKRYVELVHRDALHLLELINDLLDLSKIEAGKLELHIETFAGLPAVEEVLNGVAPLAAAKSIRLERPRSQPFTITAERTRFKQILLNLLSNAVKFTPEGGAVSVDCIAGKKQVQFCVRDNGIGIRGEDQAAIFDKFRQVGETTKGVREGTGLGLPITRHLVEAQGGKIWVESRPGAGSRFFFTLPS